MLAFRILVFLFHPTPIFCLDFSVSYGSLMSRLDELIIQFLYRPNDCVCVLFFNGRVISGLMDVL